MRTETRKSSRVFPFGRVCERLTVTAANRSPDLNTETPYLQSIASSPLILTTCVVMAIGIYILLSPIGTMIMDEATHIRTGKASS